jgi:hypothetical protein
MHHVEVLLVESPEMLRHNLLFVSIATATLACTSYISALEQIKITYWYLQLKKSKPIFTTNIVKINYAKANNILVFYRLNIVIAAFLNMPQKYIFNFIMPPKHHRVHWHRPLL